SRRDAAPDVGTPASGVGLAPGPSLASATLPRVWQGLGYRPLLDASLARPLFDFAAVRWPDTTTLAFAWGAHAVVAAGERLVAGRAGVGLYAWRGGSALWTFRETPRDP